MAGMEFHPQGLSPGTVATQMQRDIKASGMNPVSELDWSDHVPPLRPAKAMVYMCENAKQFAGQELRCAILTCARQ